MAHISKTDRLLWRCGGRLIPLDRLPCCGDTLGVWDSGTLGNCALAARKLPVRGNFDLKVGNSFRLTLAKSLLFSTTSPHGQFMLWVRRPHLPTWKYT